VICVLQESEQLEAVAADQIKQLKREQQILVAREQRLKYLRQQQMLQRDGLGKGVYGSNGKGLPSINASHAHDSSVAINSRVLGTVTE
jgi:hypothetical protein